MHDNAVSITKAIGIMLMVLGHAGFYGCGNAIIGMFHMPLFFVMSGYCFKDKYLTDFRSFAWRRVKGIYWPFVKWSLVFITLHNVFFHLNIYNAEFGYKGIGSQLYSLSDYLWHAWQIVSYMGGNESLLGGFWFLHTLFFASFIAYTAIYLCNRFKLETATGGGILLIISVLAHWLNLVVWRIDIGGKEWLAATFIVFGYVWKQSGWRINLWPLITTSIILVVVASHIHPMSMLSLTTHSTVPYFFVACAGTIMTMGLASCIDHLASPIKTLLIYIGSHTLEILTWHFLSFKLVSLLIIWAEGRPIEQLACFPCIVNLPTPWWILYFIVGVSMPCLMCKAKDLIVNKHNA